MHDLYIPLESWKPLLNVRCCMQLYLLNIVLCLLCQIFYISEEYHMFQYNISWSNIRRLISRMGHKSHNWYLLQNIPQNDNACYCHNLFDKHDLPFNFDSFVDLIFPEQGAHLTFFAGYLFFKFGAVLWEISEIFRTAKRNGYSWEWNSWPFQNFHFWLPPLTHPCVEKSQFIYTHGI